MLNYFNEAWSQVEALSAAPAIYADLPTQARLPASGQQHRHIRRVTTKAALSRCVAGVQLRAEIAGYLLHDLINSSTALKQLDKLSRQLLAAQMTLRTIAPGHDLCLQVLCRSPVCPAAMLMTACSLAAGSVSQGTAHCASQQCAVPEHEFMGSCCEGTDGQNCRPSNICFMMKSEHPLAAHRVPFMTRTRVWTCRGTLLTACGSSRTVRRPRLNRGPTRVPAAECIHSQAGACDFDNGSAGEVVVLRQLREVEILKSPAVRLTLLRSCMLKIQPWFKK